MAKFFGKVGYGETLEIRPGIWEDRITEVSYYGDVVRNSRQLRDGSKVNDDLTVGNSISIVADPYAHEHILAMRYVQWAGALWIVSNVDVQIPRLVLALGGVYNGPVPPSSP